MPLVVRDADQNGFGNIRPETLSCNHRVSLDHAPRHKESEMMSNVKDSTRRQFLKETGALAAASTIVASAVPNVLHSVAIPTTRQSNVPIAVATDRWQNLRFDPSAPVVPASRSRLGERVCGARPSVTDPILAMPVVFVRSGRSRCQRHPRLAVVRRLLRVAKTTNRTPPVFAS